MVYKWLLIYILLFSMKMFYFFFFNMKIMTVYFVDSFFNYSYFCLRYKAWSWLQHITLTRSSTHPCNSLHCLSSPPYHIHPHLLEVRSQYVLHRKTQQTYHKMWRISNMKCQKIPFFVACLPNFISLGHVLVQNLLVLIPVYN